MSRSYLQTMVTDSVLHAQDRYGGPAIAARQMAQGDPSAELRPGEQEFLTATDGFYLATVGETGWPYVQHRGGPQGFLRVLSPTTLGWADFRGNHQYLSVGNLAADARASLFVMDYAARRRLKLIGTVEVRDADGDPGTAAALTVPGYTATVERAVLFHVVGFDWNCPQHITPRFTSGEAEALQRENARLRRELARLRTT